MNTTHLSGSTTVAEAASIPPKIVRIPRRPNGYQSAQIAATSAWHGLRRALRYEPPDSYSRKFLERLIRECESAIVSNARIVARLYCIDASLPYDLYGSIRRGEWARPGQPLTVFGRYSPGVFARKVAEAL